MRNVVRLILAIAAIAALSAILPARAADMPVKAAPVPFVVGYSGNGWYKFLGTFGEMNDSQTALGNVNTFGGALNAGFGYQRANAGGGTFTAVEFSCAYHNVGGSNIVGSVTSKWSCDQGIKFGGPITSILQWLPAGASMPALPAFGSAVGNVHPWIGLFNHVQDAEASVVGVSKHNISDKVMVGAGMLQQFCTTPASCITVDTYFKFSPKQDGFTVLGTQQNIGKQYLGGFNLIF
jgi:hypothetical protein